MRAGCFSRVRLFVSPWTVAHQAPLSMGFSRQDFWSGLPCPPPRDLPDPGIRPTSLMSPALAGGFFTTEPPGKSNGILGVCIHPANKYVYSKCISFCKSIVLP